MQPQRAGGTGGLGFRHISSADVLAPVAVALRQGATRADLRLVFAGYPTLSELVFDAVRGR
ncbi:MAG: hypothetical protein GYB65_18545 [Chloroflexi bacterium]|nr:hypothetical protein [Chloroflexota bacterium]